MRLNLPIQNVIDRRVLVEPFRQTKELIDPGGTLVGYLDVGGEFGGLPEDPAPWQRRVPGLEPGYGDAGSLLAALIGAR